MVDRLTTDLACPTCANVKEQRILFVATLRNKKSARRIHVDLMMKISSSIFRPPAGFLTKHTSMVPRPALHCWKPPSFLLEESFRQFGNIRGALDEYHYRMPPCPFEGTFHFQVPKRDSILPLELYWRNNAPKQHADESESNLCWLQVPIIFRVLRQEDAALISVERRLRRTIKRMMMAFNVHWNAPKKVHNLLAAACQSILRHPATRWRRQAAAMWLTFLEPIFFAFVK